LLKHLLLLFDESLNNDCQYQVQQEKLTHYDDGKAVKGANYGDVYVHRVHQR
jgi:hypothetical protein